MLITLLAADPTLLGADSARAAGRAAGRLLPLVLGAVLVGLGFWLRSRRQPGASRGRGPSLLIGIGSTLVVLGLAAAVSLAGAASSG